MEWGVRVGGVGCESWWSGGVRVGGVHSRH